MSGSLGLGHLPTQVHYESKDTELEWLAQGHRSLTAAVKKYRYVAVRLSALLSNFVI